MNALELADYIETGGENIDRKELAAMLRQQQAEIEALKTYKPNQTLECSFDLAGFKPIWQEKPELTLTDEEIDIETTRALNDLNGSDYQLIDVAQLIAKYLMQAILRKAQDK